MKDDRKTLRKISASLGDRYIRVSSRLPSSSLDDRRAPLAEAVGPGRTRRATIRQRSAVRRRKSLQGVAGSAPGSPSRTVSVQPSRDPTDSGQSDTGPVQSHPMTARLADIATQAGVSEATVSRVLNGKPGVAAATRESVLAALDVLGYERPVRLRRRSAGLVGLITPELENPIFPALAQVIGQALTRQGYTPVLATQTPGRAPPRTNSPKCWWTGASRASSSSPGCTRTPRPICSDTSNCAARGSPSSW